MQLGYSPSTASILDLADAFRVAERLAFSFVELAWEYVELEPHSAPEGRVRELCAATGIGVTLHLPFVDLNLASLIPGARRLAVKRVQQGLLYAEAVGARCAVLHTGQNPFFFAEAPARALAALQCSLSELVCPVPMALENLSVVRTDLLRGPEALRAVTEGAGLHNCLDFGHAHLEHALWGDPTGNSTGHHPEHLISTYIETLGDRIIHLHLHGNDGAADEHRATDQGDVPYARYAEFLRDFPGTLCLEVAGGLEPLRASADHLRALAAQVALPS